MKHQYKLLTLLVSIVVPGLCAPAHADKGGNVKPPPPPPTPSNPAIAYSAPGQSQSR